MADIGLPMILVCVISWRDLSKGIVILYHIKVIFNISKNYVTCIKTEL